MSVLVVGLSHRSAPVTTLERAVVSGDTQVKLLRDVYQAEHVAGTFVVSTCNRVEVYAEVGKFHGGLSAISDLLARYSGIPLADLTPHLYVHYEDRAVQHLLTMASGLDSMVVGESQILGQVRQALALARDQGTLSRLLRDAGALALRAAKRAQAETGIGRAGANLVNVGIQLAVSSARPPAAADPAGLLAGLRVLVLGAGSMSSLAVATAARMGAAHISVANRTRDRARRLAASVSGSVADLHDLVPALAAADLVISCTGATGVVITAEMAVQAQAQRRAAAGAGSTPAGPLTLLDLALPRDVDPAAADLPGLVLVGLETLGEAGTALGAVHGSEVAAVRAIVTEEFTAWTSATQAARVAPTVVALRAKAADVVTAELARLDGKLGSLDAREHDEIGRAMRRVVDKLLHAPTVRVKELAGSPGGDSYEAALRVLFDLDPQAIDAVTRADAGLVDPAARDDAPRREAGQ
jgi:glutamyl-tRNA reductase